MNATLKSRITLLMVFIISVLVVVLSGVLLSPVIQKKEKQLIIKEAQLIYNQTTDVKIYDLKKDPQSILSKALALNNEDKLGFIFKAKKDNEFGTIEVLVAINTDHKINEVKILILDQTQYQTETQQAALDYKGLDITKLTDANSGATSVSINTLDQLIEDISLAHSNIEIEPTKPYETWFGSEYEVSDRKESVTENILLKETIKDKGFVYTISQTGLYHNAEGSIRVILILDQSYKILGIELPLEHYNHSKGNFYDSVVAYATSLIGEMLLDFPDAFNGASGSPATGNTRRLVFQMLNLVKEEAAS